MTLPASVPEDAATTVIHYQYDDLYRLTNADYTGAITATYAYDYDAVGNMAAFTETVNTVTSVVTRTFDAANRLETAFIDEKLYTYAYDDNGNLGEATYDLDPMVPGGKTGECYDYNQRNLLTVVCTIGPANHVQVEYGYDGAGNRLWRLDRTGGGDPITTTYTNDVFGLTQVLVADDGTDQVYNLFGLDLIQQDDDSTVHTLLVDGLGSVRTEIVSGSVAAVTTYSPYGEVLEQSGASGTVYGFTGEQEDSATGLLYLRARYYSPQLKVFQSRDPWEGTGWRPETLNYYVYALNNPTNLTDPSGHDPWWCEDTTCQSDYFGFDFNPRDLTSWLYREMMTNVNDFRLRQVRSANRAADTALIAGTAVAVVGTCTAILPVAIAGLAVDAGAVGVYGLAFLQYNALVGDHQTWDFKHRIEASLGRGITLCSTRDCKSTNIEYSVPGNIHFGYVSREAGYHGIVTHFGAGAAEIFDPAHHPFTSDYDYDPTGKFRVYLDQNGVGLHINFGDDPKDHDAVQFGVYLYDKYGRHFTLAQFKRELGTYMDRFARATPDDIPVAPDIASKWPYPVGYFDPTK